MQLLLQSTYSQTSIKHTIGWYIVLQALGSGRKGRFMGKEGWADFSGWKSSGQRVRPGRADRCLRWAGVKGGAGPRTPKTYGVT